MADVLEFQLQLKLVSLELTCGHTIYVSKRMNDLWRETHEAFYCSTCGQGNWYERPKVVEPPEPPRKSVGEKIVQLFKRSE